MFLNFQNKLETKISEDFANKGYTIQKISDSKCYNELLDQIYKIFLKKIKPKKYNKDKVDFLNNIHKYVDKKNINNLRLSVISEINKSQKYKKLVYLIGKELIELIVGNELAVQKNLNLSIQLPKDETSLLNIHADSFSGESPFQVVLWIPLVDVYKTKSMFLLPLKKSLEAIKNLKNKSLQTIYKKEKRNMKWLNIKSGEILIFSPNVLHGNTINKTKETRVSLNIRFKGLFTPYNQVKGNDRKLGFFYTPLNLKGASKIGMKFKFPNI